MATNDGMRVILEVDRWEMMKMGELIFEEAIRLAANEIAKGIVEKYGKKIARKIAVSVVLKETVKALALKLPTKRHADAD